MSEEFMFTIFCCLAIFSRLKYDMKKQTDLADKMMTGPEICYDIFSKLCTWSNISSLKNPFTLNRIYIIAFKLLGKFKLEFPF